MAAVFSNQLMWKERLQPPSPPSVTASQRLTVLCFFFVLCVLQKMKMEMMMTMTRRRTKTRRKRRRRRSMWSRWRRGRQWSVATPARQRPGIPALSYWRGATSPPTNIITPPIHPWGTSSRLSRNWSWRAAVEVAEEEAAAATATAGSSNRSAATASVQAPGRLTQRTMTREGLTMFWSARGGTSSSWASSPCGTRSQRWPTTRRRPKWWSWRKPQSASTTCSQTNRHSSLSKNSWGGKVNF